MTIGVLDLSNPLWMAGATFTRTLLAGLAMIRESAGCRVVFLRVDPEFASPDGIETIELGTAPTPDSWRGLRKRVPLDVVLPVVHRSFPAEEASVGWIPDFQHVQFPGNFSEQDLRARELSYRQLVETCERILVSSETVARDFLNQYPDFAEKVKPFGFPSRFAAFRPPSCVGSTVEKYHLPRKFALVTNQFWSHKNHILLPPALACLRSSGRRLPVVLTGMPSDFRDPKNQGLSRFFQSVFENGVQEDICFLGAVAEDELIDLIRSAAAIIQPSRFEGWNTTIEDAKALGRKMVCSDIPTHREQCGNAAVYFDPADPLSLGHALHQVLPDLAGGPDYEGERLALTKAGDRLRDWSGEILRLAGEAVDVRRKALLQAEPLRVSADSPASSPGVLRESQRTHYRIGLRDALSAAIKRFRG